MDETATIVERFLVDDLGLTEPIDRSENLLVADLLDSKGIAETVVFLEERFELEIEEVDLQPENFQSVAAITAFVAGKQG